jgi:hypothetical protein
VTVILFIVTLLVAPMALTEFTDWLPWIASRLILRAAAHLPFERRARYTEEWAAEFNALPGGKLTKLFFALNIYTRSRTTGAVIREELRMEQESAQASVDVAERVLSLAQQTADQAIADARREADKILGEARRQAEVIAESAKHTHREETAGL